MADLTTLSFLTAEQKRALNEVLSAAGREAWGQGTVLLEKWKKEKGLGDFQVIIDPATGKVYTPTTQAEKDAKVLEAEALAAEAAKKKKTKQTLFIILGSLILIGLLLKWKKLI